MTAIYNHYVANSTATFEERILSPQTLCDRWRADIQKPWFVAEVDDEIIGYTYAGPWKARSAYGYTYETSLYLKPGITGKGYGKKLYCHLLDTLSKQSVHVVLACITLPNPASIALHEKLGFAKVGHFSEVGFKFGQWIDVTYWQLRFEEKASPQ